MKINAKGTEIRVMGNIANEEAYISLTVFMRFFELLYVISIKRFTKSDFVRTAM